MVDDTKRLDGNGLARVWTATQKLVADNINDGVPVNGVVEFDGLEADIPDGYTKIGTRDSRLLIKKGEKTIPVRSTVVNEETASDTDVYSCEYINDKLGDVEDTFLGTIPQGDIVVNSIRSKNMFDGVLLNGVYDDTTGEFKPSVSLCSKKIKIKSSTSYYLSGVTGSVRVHYWNNNTYVGNEVITAPNSFVSQGNITAFQFGGSTPHSNIQLEEGSSATTYTSYQELNPDNFKNEKIVVGSIRSKNMVNVPTQTVTSGRTLCKINTSNISGNITISCNYNNTSSINGVLNLRETESGTNLQQGVITANTSSTLTMTIDVTNYNTIYVLVQGYSAGYNYTISNFQVETGSIATNYMPYQNLDGMENYSNGEILIGTWINGKPLYRKVFTYNINTANVQNTIAHNISNLSWVSRCDIAMYNEYDFYITGSSLTGSFETSLDGTSIYLKSLIYTGDCTIIIEYTKTTD